MKKLICVLLVFVIFCAFPFGCGGKNTVLKETDEFIVLTPTEDFVGRKLIEFMDHTKTEGSLDYTADGTFITSVNGIYNSAESGDYWMLYTDDADNSNAAWGTIEYEGKTYASAALGADSLVIAKDCVYIWVYTNVQ